MVKVPVIFKVPSALPQISALHDSIEGKPKKVFKPDSEKK